MLLACEEDRFQTVFGSGRGADGATLMRENHELDGLLSVELAAVVRQARMLPTGSVPDAAAMQRAEDAFAEVTGRFGDALTVAYSEQLRDAEELCAQTLNDPDTLRAATFALRAVAWSSFLNVLVYYTLIHPWRELTKTPMSWWPKTSKSINQ